MKRFVSIFIGFALIAWLTSCAGKTMPSPTPTPAPTATAAISDAGGQQVFLPKGDTPQGIYEPIAQPKRLYENVTKTLIPSDEYGHIWPYTGALLSTNHGGAIQIYGLCDDKGRIICDPVFHYVSELEKEGAKLYRFTRYIVPEKSKESERAAKITLARPDGTWAEEYDEIQTESQSWEYAPVKATSDSREFGWRRSSIVLDYITVRKGDKWGAVDYNGNEILPCAYSVPLCFSEGLASIVSEDGKSVYFIDGSGKAVLGPFEIPPKYDEANTMRLPLNYGLLFSEGRVHFYKGGKFGVIDKSGKIIVPAKYDYVSAYSGGTAKFLSDSKCGVLGLSGEVLLQPTELTFFNGGNMTVHFYNRDTNKSSYLNLITGERKDKADVPEQTYTYINTVVTLKTKDGDKTFSGILSFDKLRNGNFLIGLREGNDMIWKIISPEGETVAGPFSGQPGYRGKNDGHIYIYFALPRDSSKENNIRITVFDETGRRLLPDTYVSVQPFDGCFMVRTDTAIGLMEEGGKWVIKVSLYEFRAD